MPERREPPPRDRPAAWQVSHVSRSSSTDTAESEGSTCKGGEGRGGEQERKGAEREVRRIERNRNGCYMAFERSPRTVHPRNAWEEWSAKEDGCARQPLRAYGGGGRCHARAVSCACTFDLATKEQEAGGEQAAPRTDGRTDGRGCSPDASGKTVRRQEEPSDAERPHPWTPSELPTLMKQEECGSGCRWGLVLRR